MMDSNQPQSNGEDNNKLCSNSRETLPPAMNEGRTQALTQGQELKKIDNLASVMTVYECGRIFEEKDGDLTYSHTNIIFKKGDEYFYAKTKIRYKIDDDIPLDELNIEPIHIDHIWPLFPQDFTIAPNPLPINTYAKSSSLVYYEKDIAMEFSASHLLLEEARVCEILRKNPHPNIAEYLGCVVQGGRITSLCFVKYDATLATLVNQMPHKIEQIGRISLLNGIEAGVQHLHKLGLVHNDINPSNIMIDAENVPRIIDFDSCQKLGQPLGSKSGTIGFFNEGAEFAQAENDHYALSKIRDYLSLPSLLP